MPETVHSTWILVVGKYFVIDYKWFFFSPEIINTGPSEIWVQGGPDSFVPTIDLYFPSLKMSATAITTTTHHHHQNYKLLTTTTATTTTTTTTTNCYYYYYYY